MKGIARVLGVAVLLVTATVFAANLDGNYVFKSRSKEGKPDLAGWTGTMKIASGAMDREFKSADKKETKFYMSTMKNDGGDIYTCKFTNAYKPEYVGQEHKNKIVLKGSELTIESADGKFQEVWTKK